MRIRLLTALAVLLLGVPEEAQEAAQPAPHADRVLVLKKDSQGKVIRSYRVALGGDPIGPKARLGDHKTPEGVYVLDSRNGHSQFYKSLHISYPSVREREAARQRGVSPGGDVFVHGLPDGYGWVGSLHRLKDWTDGCIAVTNAEMNEIWQAVADGTPIKIRPLQS
jgi:murein L,D-transpeptidase YafK